MIDALATVHLWQTPPLHAPPRQPCPQLPQLVASLPDVLMHTPPQLVSPPGHPHVPLLHVPPVGHALPLAHPPQNVADVFRFVSQPFEATPSQFPKPVLHEAIPQAPLLQLAAAFANEHVLQVAPPVPQLVAD